MRLSQSRMAASGGLALLAALALAGCGGGGNGFGSSNNNSNGGGTPSHTFQPEVIYIADSGNNNVHTYRAASLTAAVTDFGASALPTGDTAPSAVAVDTAKKFVFAVDSTNLSDYAIAANGSLPGTPTHTTVLQTAPAASHATIAAVTIGGNTFVYVAGSAANAVYGYSVAADGTLTALAVPTADGETPYSLTIDASGKYLYVGGLGGTGQGIGPNNSSVTGYAINQADGTLTPVAIAQAGTIGGRVLMSADPAAEVVYADDSGVGDLYPFQINTATGVLTQGTEVANTTNVRSLTLNPAGTYLYTANGTAGTVTQYPIGTGGTLGTAFTTTAVTNGNFMGAGVDANGVGLLAFDSAHQSFTGYPIPITTASQAQAQTFQLTGTTTPVAVAFIQR